MVGWRVAETNLPVVAVPLAVAEPTETTLVDLFTVRVEGWAEVVSLVRTYTRDTIFNLVDI